VTAKSPLFSESEAASYLGIRPKTLRKWRSYGGGPPFVKFGDARRCCVRYRESDLDAFVTASTVASAGEVRARRDANRSQP